MKGFAAAWITIAIVFLALDCIWLTQVAPRFTRAIIGELMAPQVRLAPAIAFYLIYITAIVVLAVSPEQGAVWRAFGRGAMLGLVAYATYDLTNQATLRVWSTTLTLADLAWGAALTAVAAALGSLAAARFS